MEEAWKEINLPSLHTPTAFRGVVLQDFLARPFSKDPTTHIPPVGYGSSQLAATRPSPPLTLNFDPDHQYLGSVNPEAPNCRGPFSNVGPLNDVLSGENGGLKRLPDNGRSAGVGGGKRHKRMIKNRESAARSRAKKQESLFSLSFMPMTYTNELELEVERLKRENASLRKHQLQLSEEAAYQFTNKSTLQRTLSAPF